ncbi:hypothetical protein B0H11DRAFT_1907399 [Mycena galericulata]|nr:hypothetical protein B0H11DRAFT_1907399 [Mycena galericulata]
MHGLILASSCCLLVRGGVGIESPLFVSSTLPDEPLRHSRHTAPNYNQRQGLVQSAIAASVIEVCAAAALVCFLSSVSLGAEGDKVDHHKGDKLAAYTLDQTALLINRMIRVPVSPDVLQLQIFEQNLDAIRQHLECMPVRSRGYPFGLLNYRFHRETSRLKRRRRHTRDQLAICSSLKSATLPDASRSECILELVSLSTRAAGAVCDAPVLNFLKPVVGIASLICETARSVGSNRDAALDLSKHANIVTKCVVEHASAMDGAYREALRALELTLEEIQAYLTALNKLRRRAARWIFVNVEKDRFVQLNGALDKALVMFSSATILSTAEEVRSNTRQIGALVFTVGCLDSDVNRTLTSTLKLSWQTIHADPAKLLGAASTPTLPTCEEGTDAGSCATPESQTERSYRFYILTLGIPLSIVGRQQDNKATDTVRICPEFLPPDFESITAPHPRPTTPSTLRLHVRLTPLDTRFLT